jgi:isocitrate/isopropylmalate dehydrogenase
VPIRMTHYKIAEIGGDGIGPDAVAEAVRVLDAAGDRIETAMAKARQ